MLAQAGYLVYWEVERYVERTLSANSDGHLSGHYKSRLLTIATGVVSYTSIAFVEDGELIVSGRLDTGNSV